MTKHTKTLSRKVHPLFTTQYLIAFCAVLLTAIFAATFFSLSTQAASVRQVSTGSSHACAIADSRVRCWGNNASGQLGNDSRTDSSVPVSPYAKDAYSETVKDYCNGISFGDWCSGGWVYKTVNHAASALYGKSISKVSAGQFHTCAIASARVYCWGNGGNGRLGNDATSDSSRPVAVNTSGVLRGKEVTDVSAGYGFSCALASDGTVACWGENGNAQLGTGNRNDSRVPVAVSKGTGSALQNVKVKKLAQLKGEVSTMCVITDDDKAVCWGNDDLGQAGVGYSLAPTHVSASGSNKHTSDNRCSETDRKAKAELKNNLKQQITINQRDALNPQQVSTNQRFSDLTITANSNLTQSVNDLTKGSIDAYAYVTGLTTTASPVAQKTFYWGGTGIYQLSGECKENKDYKNADGDNGHEWTESKYTIDLDLFVRGTPTGPLYNTDAAGALANQQLALHSGNAFLGGNHEQDKQCVSYTVWYLFWSETRQACSKSVEGVACATRSTDRASGYCDTAAKTCTDNSNGSALHILALKAAGQYRQTCTPDGPQPIPSGGSNWLQSSAPIIDIDSGFSKYACAVANDTIGCWGAGSRGQLGNGAKRDSATPVKVGL